MITAFFIFDPKGDVIMSKIYKAGVKRNISDVFRIQIISANNISGNGVKSPVLTLGSTSFVYIKSGQLWICAVTRSNQDCGAVLEFIYKLEQLIRTLVLPSSSKVVHLTDELITNNFNLIYEVLEEVVEFGYPTNLDLGYLKSVVTSVSSSDGLFKRTLSSDNSKIKKKDGSAGNGYNNSSGDGSSSGNGDISWRPSGIKYRRNEIFLNVEEKVNVLLSPTSEVLRSYVDGCINMKTHLSGMPECRFGFNDESVLAGDYDDYGNSEIDIDMRKGIVKLEDSKFHQCVELSKFDSERVIQFIPPDGEFQLMSYQSCQNINLPFKIHPQVTETGTRKLQYRINISSLFTSKIAAREVVVKIPTPKGVIRNLVQPLYGKCKFNPEENLFVWKFNKFFGQQDHFLNGEVELSPDLNIASWSRPPIKLDFNIDMFSGSGLTVQYLKVQEKSNYRTVKWVKYMTSSGSYDIRY